jgi:hypothetical protein
MIDQWLSTGMGFANPRQMTMNSAPAPQQKAPALNAGRLPVTPRGNVITAQANAGVGGFGNDGILYGRMSLGFVGSLVILLTLAYVWTRNVQGGG